MSTWDALHKEHAEIFVKVNLLEKALVDLLQKHTEEQAEKSLEQQKAFLDAFTHGITLHFTVEEKALFPEMKKIGQIAETLIDELLIQHKSILGKYSEFTQSSYDGEKRREILLGMLKELFAHTQKEEQFVYPLVKQLSKKQLEEVDHVANQLGYRL